MIFMVKFIYVFSKEDRDYLVNVGYKLLKSDERNDIYIFNSSTELNFALSDVKEYMESSTLTF